MRIFIAGSTGAIGKPVVIKLLQRGHEVYGMTHSSEHAANLENHGAIPVLVDAFDSAAIEHEIAKIKPDVVYELLSSFPKSNEPDAIRHALLKDAHIRIEGGATLHAAAKKAGVKRYIFQSSAFWYEPGEGLASEETPFSFESTPSIAASCHLYAQNEAQILNCSQMDGVVLRVGFYYGPETWYSPKGTMAELAHLQKLKIVGDGGGIWNFVHIEDAAEAFCRAIECPPGVYNITDDTPVDVTTWAPAFAEWVGAPTPEKISCDEALTVNGLDSVYYATRLRGASNAKAKKELHMHFRPLEWLNGALSR